MKNYSMNFNLKKYFYPFIFITIVFSMSVNAADRIEMDTTSIVGNRELPKILYIVPWKNAELPDMNAPPINSLIDEALAPVDRDTLKRQIRYFQIYSNRQKSQSENQ